jgi:hypothetical protein
MATAVRALQEGLASTKEGSKARQLSSGLQLACADDDPKWVVRRVLTTPRGNGNKRGPW